jgi:hypothetical protein
MFDHPGHFLGSGFLSLNLNTRRREVVFPAAWLGFLFY